MGHLGQIWGACMGDQWASAWSTASTESTQVCRSTVKMQWGGSFTDKGCACAPRDEVLPSRLQCTDEPPKHGSLPWAHFALDGERQRVRLSLTCRL